MSRLIASAVLAGAMLISSPALADDEFHCAKPGTRIGFNNRSPVEIVGQEGFACLVRVADSKAPSGTSVIRMLLGISSYAAFAENHGERLWPFKIGNEIEFTSSGDESHLAGGASTSSDRVYYRDNIRVLRQEKLVTKMGTLDTWVIEDRQISQSRLAGTWITTYWWAPEVGYIVKHTFEVRTGLGTDQTDEITSIQTPASTSPPVTSSVTPPAAPTATPPASPASIPAPASTPAKAMTKTPTATPSAAPTASPPPAGSVADRLQALKDLLDRKLITPSEYDAKRKAILESL